jgi:hypothetical protein
LGRKNQGKQYNYRIFHPVNCTGWKWLGQVVRSEFYITLNQFFFRY